MSSAVLKTEEAAADPVVVVEKIASRDLDEQQQATRALESGDPVYFEALLTILERENRKKPRRFGIALVVILALVISLMTALDKLLHFNVSSVFNGMWYLWLGVAAVFAPTRLQRAAARRLAESDDIRAVGPLAEALDKQDGATKKAAAIALTRLLPRLKHSDGDLLNERQRGFLLEGFGKGDRNFKLAVLKSLPQIGDQRFLKSVTAMAGGKGSGKKDAEIRELSAECLEGLKARIEEDKPRMSLLHPAESAGNSGTLLRAAGPSQSDPQLLLRAAESSDQAT